MIWVFTCATVDCIHNLEPVNLCNPSNPVMCGACFAYTDAVETDKPCPVVTDAVTN
jgi:hypothetical protein